MVRIWRFDQSNANDQRNNSPKTYELQVVIELDEDGKYVAFCPALEACYTQGDTFEEAIENIHDVVTMCLEEARQCSN